MSSYGLIVLKPDCFEDNVNESILTDIEGAGLEIVLAKFFHFHVRHITLLCPPIPKEKENMYFHVVKNYTSADSQILIVKSAYHDAINHILKVKGKIDEGGLRKKYFPFNIKEMYKLETSNPSRFAYMKARNRIHSPDTKEELIKLLREVLTANEIIALVEKEIDWAKELLLTNS